MELITNRPNTQVVKQPFVEQIIARWGDAPNFVKNWMPNQQSVIVKNLDKSANVPSIVRLTKTYGQLTMEALINLHLTDAIVVMGEPIESVEVNLIVRAMIEDERLKTLNLAFFIAFFKRLKSGRYKIYGELNSRKILEAAQEYYDEIYPTQQRVIETAKKEEEQRKQKEHEANSLTWEEYCTKTGYTGENPINKLNK